MNFTKEVKNERKNTNKIINYMGGISFKLNPLLTLKLISASSIFGEPKYYMRSNMESVKKLYKPNEYLLDKIYFKEYMNLSSENIFENAIDEALEYDFRGTLEWAIELRNTYYMRLNPQIILVRAMLHHKRVKFNKKNPGLVRDLARKIILRGDEPTVQLTYYLYINKTKNKLPTILKKIWRDKLQTLSTYEINKYKNSHIGIIDTVRICHAYSNEISNLLKKSLQLKEKDLNWKNLRSSKKSWKKIIEKNKLGHMALLTNLHGIFKEISNKNDVLDILKTLENGVLNGKIFPYRYYQAMIVLENEILYNKTLILDSLEKCMDISLSNLPKLKGKTVCLSDNSGSCWKTFTSQNDKNDNYGKTTIAEINNLSSVITACNSEDGEVIKFGDTIMNYPVSARRGILYQSKIISENKYNNVGGRTENGIWQFFKESIKNKTSFDNIFIYSDQQAGHGKLYGINSLEYSDYALGNYLDIPKLIKKYRQVVNENVNIFSVQTAGYGDCVIPEYMYRTYILSGWTGKEILFANMVNEIMENKIV